MRTRVPKSNRLFSRALPFSAGLAACCALVIATTGTRTLAYEVSLQVRDSFLPGVPVLVRVELLRDDGALAREVWDAEAQLTASEAVTLTPSSVTLRNGVGSALVTVAGLSEDPPESFEMAATVGETATARTITSLAGAPITEVSGTLAAPLTEWSGIVRVTDDLTVPESSTLIVAAGTLVLLDGVTDGSDGTDINVIGRLESRGTAEAPVTFTAAVTDEAWGEIHVEPFGSATLTYTTITRAGNSPGGGHTGSGPAFRPDTCTLTFEHSSITDCAGKVMQGSSSELEFRHTLFARCVMGPEVSRCGLLFEHSYIFEMFGPDDNDGIYMHRQEPEQTLLLRDSIVAAGDDDAIDTLDSDVTVENCIVRDFADKGVSVFRGSAVVRGCLFVGNDIGVSAKGQGGGGAEVTVDHCTFSGQRLGIEARDKFDEPDLEILYDVRNSIVWGGTPVRTDYPPEDITITYSAMSDDWPGAGNIATDPRFVDPPTFDFHLQAGSPCIDAGDPDAELDPDGSRTDMGAFPFLGDTGVTFVRGQVNEDSTTDVSDAITLLLHLFSSREIGCRDAADLDDNGSLQITDAIFLLNFLFGSGPPPHPPGKTCGLDPTEDDDLDCAAAVCP